MRRTLALTLLILVARLSAVPPLSDPVAGAAPPSLHLTTPALYLLLAPLFSTWDGISMLSMSRLKGFLIGLTVLYLLWRCYRILTGRRFFLLRELQAVAVSLVLLGAFIVVGALWHRPMLSLAGTKPGDIVVDFHSHTNASHDVADTWLRGFDAEANRRWHARAGFDAVFITDHNVPSRESRVASREGPVLCPGIEVSAWRAHIVLLGDTLPVDRSRYNGSLDELLQLIRTSKFAYNAVSVASLPEYRRSHWTRLDTLLASGLDGFEIVNASPKANELTRRERNWVIALARTHDRFVIGVSDSHGWGATSMVWNLVRAPSSPVPVPACEQVLRQLRQGFSAVRVIERHRLRKEDPWPEWLTPVGVLWETWRSMGWGETVSWIAWVWLAAFLLRRRPSRTNIA